MANYHDFIINYRLFRISFIIIRESLTVNYALVLFLNSFLNHIVTMLDKVLLMLIFFFSDFYLLDILMWRFGNNGSEIGQINL
jgi:hypothetical protein